MSRMCGDLAPCMRDRGCTQAGIYLCRVLGAARTGWLGVTMSWYRAAMDAAAGGYGAKAPGGPLREKSRAARRGCACLQRTPWGKAGRGGRGQLKFFHLLFTLCEESRSRNRGNFSQEKFCQRFKLFQESCGAACSAHALRAMASIPGHDGVVGTCAYPGMHARVRVHVRACAPRSPTFP